jgi:RNA ligase (TIGR02306 family)
MDMERKLVTIRLVSDIQPIEGADQIEVAQVDGWKCVVKKGDFKVGDKGVYFEIDSILPDRAEFEFMRHRHFRVRTIKLRGQVSQGLLMPINTFPETADLDPQPELGTDVTELLGVVKYELPLPADLAGRVRGNFPSFISKTDQERCQNITREIQDLLGTRFEVTEKLDGSSMTVYLNEDVFGVCSRNLDLKEGETPDESCTQWKVAREMGLEAALKIIGDGYALQGELIGEGIQKNPYKMRGHHFRIFDLFDIKNQRYLTSDERMPLIKTMGLEDFMVPVINHDFILGHNVDDLLKLAEGKSALADTEREGLVFKSKDLVKGNTFSFKAISNAFLLSEE